MRIGIIGAGGVGGYLGVKLAQAGHPVALVARGSQLEAIKTDGLRLIEPEGETTWQPTVVSDDAAVLSDCDLVILTVKAHQLPAAISQVRDAVAPHARLLPLQNGVDAPDVLAAQFGKERALIGVARIFVNISAPGVLTRYGTIARFTIGTLAGAAVEDVQSVFQGAGVDAPALEDARVDLWTKFVMFNALSSLTAATRSPFGVMRATPATSELVHSLMQETAALGRAAGVLLPDDLAETCFAMFETLPEEGRTSTAHDLDQGRALEIDWTCGAAIRLGEKLGVTTPISRTLYAVLAPWKDGS
ncbi:MAG: 2-dehydropantoate 2-reductase [Pseudomonadota bacterium]